jgi:hypothetical protein
MSDSCNSRSGAFIALYDEPTLKLYLKHGVYATLLRDWTASSKKSSKHFAALCDYCTLRPGSEIFFFLKRKFVYGGRVSRPKDYASELAAFHLNGAESKWGNGTGAPLLWDESNRARYSATRPGFISVPGVGERFQPYLLKFETDEDLTGRWVWADELYWGTAKQHMFPLPSNSMQGMSFCILSPAEVTLAKSLLTRDRKRISLEDVEGSVCQTAYAPSLANNPFAALPASLSEAYSRAFNENELEAFLLGNPKLLEPAIRLGEGDVLSRQVPLCPFKSGGMDRADIVVYSNDERYAALPRAIVEVKLGEANAKCYRQLARYLEWLAVVRTVDFARNVDAVLVAAKPHRKAKPPKEWPNIKTLTPEGIA